MKTKIKNREQFVRNALKVVVEMNEALGQFEHSLDKDFGGDDQWVSVKVETDGDDLVILYMGFELWCNEDPCSRKVLEQLLWDKVDSMHDHLAKLAPLVYGMTSQGRGL